MGELLSWGQGVHETPLPPQCCNLIWLLALVIQNSGHLLPRDGLSPPLLHFSKLCCRHGSTKGQVWVLLGREVCWMGQLCSCGQLAPCTGNLAAVSAQAAGRG